MCTQMWTDAVSFAPVRATIVCKQPPGSGHATTRCTMGCVGTCSWTRRLEWR
jgi:hypothetical protein